MKTFEISKIPIKIVGNHPVASLVLQELAFFQSTSESPEVVFNFTDKENVQADSNSLNLGKEIYISEENIYIDFPNYRYVVKIPIQPQTPLNVDIGFDTHVVPTNFKKRVIEMLAKINDRTYLSRLERMAYSFFLTFEFILFLLYQHNKTVLHGSSITRNNRTVLITGWGGTGKTSTQLQLISKHGWKYLSDDISLVDSIGNVYYYPRYIMIYPYNLLGQKELYLKLIGERNLVDRLQWALKKRQYGLHGVRRRISPVSIHGKDNIGISGKITQVIYIIRYKNTSFELQKCNGVDLVPKVANVVAAEYSHYL
ncbi:MAG: hypothetical protein H8D45_31285, partial [Bacteroidetes bacterium]|nr:hypothetical protein [Bacteroidota bacterium]